MAGPRDVPAPADVLQKMTSVLGHRGPDDQDRVVLDGVGLGHRRLSIVDLTNAGRQPMSTPDGQLWIVYNGEIYNHLSLKADLEKRGHRFQTRTDTEVLLYLYREFGDDCVNYLRGMFSFAIWDNSQRRLMAARDRFGQKPFFYARSGQQLVFASELKSLMQHPGITRQRKASSIHRFLSLDYIPAPDTIYENVHKLPAAHRLVFENGELSISRYWKLDYGHERIGGSREDRQQELLHRFDEAVKLRLMGEVPVGVFLSGGIDSNSIAASVASVSGQQVETFSIGFADPEQDESGQAREAAEYMGCRHHELVMEPQLNELLPRIVRHFDEPFGDPSALPTWSLAEMAGQHITVALSGEGGDEALGGYPRYQKHLLASRLWTMPQGIRNRLGKAVSALSPASLSAGSPWRGLGDLLAVQEPELSRVYGRWLMHSDERRGQSLYSEDFRQQLNLSGPVDYLERLFAESSATNLLDAMLDVDQRSYLADGLLTKLDMCTMAHSVEGRSPFLDHELAEFMARLPHRDKLHGGEGKWLFRRALADRVAPGVMHRPKRGFGLPLAGWLSGPLNEMLRDTLGSSELMDPAALARLLDKGAENGNGWRPDEPYLVWNLMVLELWLQAEGVQDGLNRSTV